MKILEVEPENTGTYMSLSSIYASTWRWREAAKLRMEMKDKGLKKQPGCSWIDIGNKVHVFVVGDDAYTESNFIFPLLYDLHAKMEAGRVIKVNRIMEEDFPVGYLFGTHA
ncbi:hypothetical protein RHMOL_Rhmol03G0125200 [Rhododendron molle]|uniref:Uncharacterized protein n=1 Tax=Rhododendron molle TaxID=49168 RepID=A0ACC0PFU1_RHOML|nr:hypothetical protein RHMOL_Rhmol03G0125200 [Rhododendron molle]